MAISGIEGSCSIHDLLKASRVEEDHQIEQWGLVEGGHDIDIAEVHVRVAAPMVFLKLLRSTL